MDVSRISQGGQISISINGNSNDTDQASEVTNAPQADAVQKSVNGNADSKPADNRNNVSEAEVKKAMDKLKSFIDDDNTRIEYQYHKQFTNDLMIKIIDKKTNEVLLEVPPQKILDLVAKMMEMVGVLFDKKA